MAVVFVVLSLFSGCITDRQTIDWSGYAWHEHQGWGWTCQFCYSASGKTTPLLHQQLCSPPLAGSQSWQVHPQTLVPMSRFRPNVVFSKTIWPVGWCGLQLFQCYCWAVGIWLTAEKKRKDYAFPRQLIEKPSSWLVLFFQQNIKFLLNFCSYLLSWHWL